MGVPAGTAAQADGVDRFRKDYRGGAAGSAGPEGAFLAIKTNAVVRKPITPSTQGLHDSGAKGVATVSSATTNPANAMMVFLICARV